MTTRTRRRTTGWLVAAGVVIAALVAAVVLLPRQTSAASGSTTATARTGTVSVTVSASGSLVDETTFAIAYGADPTLTERAGVAVSSGGSASSSSGSSSSGSTGSSSSSGTTSSGDASSGSSSGSATGASTSASAAGGTTVTTKEIAVQPGQRVAKNAKLAVVEDADGVRHTVRAPMAGVVRSLSTAVGASGSQLLTLGTGPVLASVDVNENQITSVRGAQHADVVLGSSTTHFDATVRSIAQLPDGSTGVQRYQVVLTPGSLPAGLRVGMSVTAAIRIASASGVVTVPTTAVDTSGGRVVVQRVRNDKTTTVPVKIGLVGDDLVEVTSGLAAGDRVVTGVSGSVPSTSRGFGGSGGSGATPSASASTSAASK